MNLAETLVWATDYLQNHQIEDARLEAKILLAHALDLKKTDFITQNHRIIESKEYRIIESFLHRRIKHEPAAYITGSQPFMSLDFFVDRSVLIPRPETEILVETVIDLIKKPETKHLGFPSILDLGTGSGCIAVSLAKYLPNVEVVGIDSSPEAIAVACRNAEFHKVEDRCKFIVQDFFATKTLRLKEFDIIVSNPPYIPTAEIETLQPEVRDYEPRQALDGGPDGLYYIRYLIRESTKHLKENGHLILEFGFSQAEKIKELAKEYFMNIKIMRDDSGKERIFLGQSEVKGL